MRRFVVGQLQGPYRGFAGKDLDVVWGLQGQAVGGMDADREASGRKIRKREAAAVIRAHEPVRSDLLQDP